MSNISKQPVVSQIHKTEFFNQKKFLKYIFRLKTER